jgi:hypothetical protein
MPTARDGRDFSRTIAAEWPKKLDENSNIAFILREFLMAVESFN